MAAKKKTIKIASKTYTLQRWPGRPACRFAGEIGEVVKDSIGKLSIEEILDAVEKKPEAGKTIEGLLGELNFRDLFSQERFEVAVDMILFGIAEGADRDEIAMVPYDEFLRALYEVVRANVVFPEAAKAEVLKIWKALSTPPPAKSPDSASRSLTPSIDSPGTNSNAS